MRADIVAVCVAVHGNSALLCLKDGDAFVQRNAAVAVREVVKHSEELASIVVRAGGAGGLVEYINATTGSPRLAAVMAIGACKLPSDLGAGRGAVEGRHRRCVARCSIVSSVSRGVRVCAQVSLDRIQSRWPGQSSALVVWRR